MSELKNDSRLSKYDPLSSILFYDDFDDGIQGWTELVGNYEGSLDSMLPPYRDHRPPQLSTLAMWDSGSVGSMDGMYALKIATKPKKGHQSVNIKRITFRKTQTIRLETYFCFKPEAIMMKLGDQAPRSFGFLFDLQNQKERVMPHVRYLNSLNGELVQEWQFKKKTQPFIKIGDENKTVSHYHLAEKDWENFPDGKQSLCYNEIATKHNWHYLRFDFNLENMQAEHLQCNDKIIDISTFDSIRINAMPNLWSMLNIAFFVETDTDQRVFGYLDSVVLSQEQ